MYSHLKQKYECMKGMLSGDAVRVYSICGTEQCLLVFIGDSELLIFFLISWLQYTPVYSKLITIYFYYLFLSEWNPLYIISQWTLLSKLASLNVVPPLTTLSALGPKQHYWANSALEDQRSNQYTTQRL